MLFGIVSSVLLLATPAPYMSAAAFALSRGDLDAALSLPANDSNEAALIEAQVHLARFDLQGAERAADKMKEGAIGAPEVRLYLARARHSPQEIGSAARRVCERGDITGRSCAEAELYADPKLPPARVELPHDTTLALSPSAPLPVTTARAGKVETGWVLDTGASETVIASSLARELGLKVTRASFPVGVAAGGAQVMGRLAVLPTLTLGDAVVHNLRVLVLDLPELEAVGVRGILSPQQALRGLAMTLDYPRLEARLSRGGKAAPAKDGGAVTVPYFAANLDLAVPARIGNGRVALFGVDTGMQGACAVSEDYEGVERAEGPTIELTGAGASATATLTQPAQVVLGKRVLGMAACSRTPMKKPGVGIVGLLGNELWRDQALTLDTVARTITLRPSSSPATPRPSGR